MRKSERDAFRNEPGSLRVSRAAAEMRRGEVERGDANRKPLGVWSTYAGSASRAATDGSSYPRPVSKPVSDRSSDSRWVSKPRTDGSSYPRPVSKPATDGSSHPPSAPKPKSDGSSDPRPASRPRGMGRGIRARRGSPRGMGPGIPGRFRSQRGIGRGIGSWLRISGRSAEPRRGRFENRGGGVGYRGAPSRPGVERSSDRRVARTPSSRRAIGDAQRALRNLPRSVRAYGRVSAWITAESTGGGVPTAALAHRSSGVS